MKSGGRILSAVLCVAFTLFVAPRCQAQQWDWVQRFQGGNSLGNNIKLDGAGNIYIAGIFEGAITLGTNQLLSAGGLDLFVAKFTSNGEPLWITKAGSLAEDRVNGLAVSADGTVFICGSFSTQCVFGTNTLTTVSNEQSDAFVARIDDGQFSWVQPFGSEFNDTAWGITISPNDQSLGVTGQETNRLFIKVFGQDGRLLSDFFRTPSWASIGRGIAVASNGNVFVTGSFRSPLILGTTNLTASETAQFTLALNSSGNVLWAWVADRGYPSAGFAIALGSDGSVFSAGRVQRSAFGGAEYDYAFLSKHSPDGNLLWMRTRGEHRGSFNATDLAVAPNDYILMTGWGAGSYFDSKSRRGAYVYVFDTDGNKISEQAINSHSRGDDNVGWGITTDANGDAYITGYLKGTPTFGTNVMGKGASGVAGAFVARRATLQPVLLSQQSGPNFILSWPRTALPFLLQQSDESGSDWVNVSQLPEEMDGRRQVTLPNEQATGFFRLVVTNEVPIRHVPDLWGWYGQRFLDHTNLLIVRPDGTTPLSLGAVGDDDDGDKVTFTWVDTETGGLISTGRVETFYGGLEYEPFYQGMGTNYTVSFPVGFHQIALILSDGTFSVTNSQIFEVITLQDALDRFVSAAEPLATTRVRRQALVVLKQFRRAFDDGKLPLAIKRWERLQGHLSRRAFLGPEFILAAERIGFELHAISP